MLRRISQKPIPVFKIACVVVACLLFVLYVTDEIGIERASQSNQLGLRLNLLGVSIHVDHAIHTASTGEAKDAIVATATVATKSNISPALLVAITTATATQQLTTPTLDQSSSATEIPKTPSPSTQQIKVVTTTTTAATPITTTTAERTTSVPSTFTRSPEDERGAEVTCKFPVLNPFDKSILKYVDHPKGFSCAGFQPNFTFIDDDGYIHANPSEIQQQNQTDTNPLTCYWRTVDRAPGDNDDALAYGEKHEFNASLVPAKFDDKADTVEVACEQNGTRVYYNLHNHPKNIDKKIEDSSEEQLSVFFFIHDSVSLSLFRRHLPDTYKYVTDTMGVRIFHGYTKVADNTFPNMVPVLTGKRVYNQQADMPDERPPAPNKQYDTWNLIWKDFAKKGYVTSFVEDSPTIGLFHYLAGGFAKKPVDHYLRPYFMAVSNADYGEKYCFGNVPEYQNEADISLRILRKYKNKRHFMYSFYTYMSHDNEATIERSDPIFVDFFKKIHEENLLNRTIMFLMSDHGHRFAGLRATLVGLLEERMPIYGIYLPPWFYKKYPHIDQAIRTNQWRLSANFDIHQVLLDVLSANFTAKQLPNGTRGLSQFYEIPPDRTCNQAGIPEHYCVCANAKPVNPDSELAKKAAQYTVDKLNTDLKEVSKLCEELQLKEIQRAESFEVNQFVVLGAKNAEQRDKIKDKDATDPDMKIVRVLVKAAPSDAMLEASVHMNTKTWEMDIPNDISRVNQYGNQSICIDDARLRRYCYCKERTLMK